MKKMMFALVLLIVLTGCTKRVENPGPPQITILEDAILEVNQPDFSQDQLRAYFKALDCKGNILPQQNVSFLNQVNISLLGTTYVKVKAVDDNGYYDIKTLKVTTQDHTAPTIQLPVSPPVTLVGSQPILDLKVLGIQVKDNFNREETLVSNAKFLSTTADYQVAGSYGLPIQVTDSSNNRASDTLTITVTSDPLELANYLYEKMINITQGSQDYLMFDQHDEVNQRTALLNYNLVFESLFSEEGLRQLEASPFYKKIEKQDEMFYWKWNNETSAYSYIESGLTIVQTSDETITGEVNVQWKKGTEIVKQTHDFVLIKEDDLWKIKEFYYPLEGPDLAKTTPSPIPSAKPKS